MWAHFSFRTPPIESVLRAAAAKVAAILPIEVQDGITFVEARAEGTAMIFVYELTGERSEFGGRFARFYEASLRRICSDQNSGLMLAHGVRYRHIVLVGGRAPGSDQTPAAKFEVQDASCKPLTL